MRVLFLVLLSLVSSVVAHDVPVVRWLDQVPDAPLVVSESVADTPRDPKQDLLLLIGDMNTLGTAGLSEESAAVAILHVQQAMDNKAIPIKEGLELIQLIQRLIKQGGPPSLADGITIAKVLQALLDKVLANFDANPQVCRRTGTGRGVGTPMTNNCHPDEDSVGALCYPKCKDGYEAIGCCICRKKGCDSGTDIGVSCAKPAAYGRGVGYALWHGDKCRQENSGGCEKYGALFYPTCKPGFHNVGCCVCSPNCPTGTHDDGAFCGKDWYGRGVGVSRRVCPSGKQANAGLCYDACPAGQDGVGPMCWPTCKNATSHNCGLMCTSTAATCASTVIDIMSSTAQIILYLTSKNYSDAINAGIQLGLKTFTIKKC